MAKARKTAKKTAIPEKVPQPNGKGALYAGGVPGNAGGTGRPPNWLRDWCDDLLARPKTQRAVEAILDDKKHPAFAAMWKAVGERAKGKPHQSLEVSGKGGTPLTIRVVHE